MRYARAKDGYWVGFFVLTCCDASHHHSINLQYRTVNMHTGDPAYLTVDSLSAFWPGLQVLAGDVHSAIKLHMICSFTFLPMSDRL